MTTNKQIKNIYSLIVKKYAKVNTILTLGIDAYWRKVAAKTMMSIGGDLWLDVCCGTGDLTWLLAKNRFYKKKSVFLSLMHVISLMKITFSIK
ncbi:MAG: class I SAM-dependent methyltransferase [Candidatus Omnitrophica bacterium]|nr:class I SAM-dependent methyltransferase [Candidatus Omnitrophota bacterium]